MRMFEVKFYGVFPDRIIFAKNRQEIWKKYSNVREICRVVVV